MKKLVLSIFLTLGVFYLRAQFRDAGLYGEVFRLSAREARLMLVDQVEFDSTWLHTSLGFRDSSSLLQLPPGHYLFLQAQQEKIRVSAVDIQPFEVNILSTRRDVILVVTDRSGKRLDNAVVTLQGKKIRFDAQMEGYRLAKRRKKGILEIKAMDYTGFLEIRPNQYYSMPKIRWNRFAATRVGPIVAVPWYHIRNAWNIARNAGDFYMYWDNWGYKKEHQWDVKESWSGYTAFSQPKYKPGDTLKVKAWVTTRKGKPWNKPLDLIISKEYSGKSVGTHRLQPSAPGVFLWQTVLNDSMEIDRKYEFSFTNPNPRTRGLFRRYETEPGAVSGIMAYEDYLLDEVIYEFTQDREIYHPGDSILFHVHAKDANGQSIPDGTYDLLVRSNSVSGFYGTEVLVPDTIWQTEGMLSASGETTIRIPENRLPPAAYKLTAEIYCRNSAGELQYLELKCTVDRRLSGLDAKIEKGWLLVNWKDPASLPKTAVLRRAYPQMADEEEVISLPYKVRIQPEVSAYNIRCGQEHLYLNLNDPKTFGHQINGRVFRLRDTVACILDNPHRIPIRYRIVLGNKEWHSGIIRDSVWYWQDVDPGGHDFYFYHTFIWAGKEEKGNAWDLFYKNMLEIDLDQPENVLPGEQVQVKVRINDQNQQPAAGVQVTAAAYNALFKEDKPYTIPSVRYSGKPRPLTYPPFDIGVLQAQAYTLPLNGKWYDRLRLDTIPYYRLRHLQSPLAGAEPSGFALSTPIYPDAFLFVQPGVQQPDVGLLPDLPRTADSFFYKRPQFAPFVVANHQSQPVYMIWVNKYLVYYYGNTDRQPYSFYGEYGYNTIKLRVRNGEYTIDSVYLEKGKKLIFSIYGAEWSGKPQPVKAAGDALKHARVRWEARPDSLNAFEQTYLQRSMLLLREGFSPGAGYFWDYATGIHIVRNEKRPFHIIGPFPPNSRINALAPGQFITNFQFDPGFEYEIKPQRERLYASRWPARLGRFPRKLLLRSMNDWAIGPHQIQRSVFRYTFNRPDSDQRGAGSLYVQFDQRKFPLKAIVFQRDTSVRIYTLNTTKWEGLQPAIYRLLLYTPDGMVAERNIRIRPDTLLCLDLSGMAFRVPLPAERFDSLYQSRSVGAEKSNPVPDRQSSSYKPVQVGWGYGTLIQGQITDDTGEPLIGATVIVRQGDELIKGTVTDMEGNYQIEVLPGTYSIEISYTGFITQQVTGIPVWDNQAVYINPILAGSTALQEVVVTAYSVGLVQQDRTSAASISYLSTRNVSAGLAGKVAAVEIRGARSDTTHYYIDGIRVAGLETPLRQTEAFTDGPSPRSKFRDHAYWQPNLVTDRNGEAVFQATFPDDLTSWESYAIATDKKGRAGVGIARVRAAKALTAQLAVPRFAIEGDRFDIAGRITNHSADSMEVKTRFLFNNGPLKENKLRVLQGAAEYASLTIPAGLDSAQILYELQSGKIADGEQRSVPILPIGTTETNGRFVLLESDSVVRLSFDRLQSVTIYAGNSVLDLLLKDIDYLYLYPYGCNEQTAGKLIALLSLKKIKAYKSESFKFEKDLLGCLRRLKNTQLADGSWGWWSNSTPNTWMTLYVARALFTAKQAGYKVDGLEKALLLLRQALPSMQVSDQSHALMLLLDSKVNLDCTPYLLRYDSLPSPSLADRLNRWKLAQQCVIKVEKDSLLKYAQRTTFGGIYFGSGETGWYDRKAVLTLDAYDIARTAGWADITRGIERYWLQHRSKQTNTIETARILEALLPGLLNRQATFEPLQVQIDNRHFDRFPIVVDYMPGQGQFLEVSKTGSGPVFLTAYQQWHEPAPAARTDLFEVTTRLLLANGTTARALRYGEAATLEVRVAVKSAADYVMIEVPIPAGCGYGDKVQKGWPEVHREHFKDRTAIFCEHLPVGEYVFSIPLEPRFTGSFTLNPARVEQMYFPVFYGRNVVKKVAVEK